MRVHVSTFSTIGATPAPIQHTLTWSSTVYTNLGKKYTLEYPTTILACLAFCVTVPIYIFYWKGPAIRERSKFAQTLASDRKAGGGHRVATEKSGANADRMEEP